MPFLNCELNQNEFREYDPGYPFVGKAFIPYGGTIYRENDLKLFKYGNGPLREPSNDFQFIFDYKGTPLHLNCQQVQIVSEILTLIGLFMMPLKQSILH